MIGSVFTGRGGGVVAAEERRPRKGEVSQKEFANCEDSFHNREIGSGG